LVTLYWAELEKIITLANTCARKIKTDIGRREIRAKSMLIIFKIIK